MNKSVMALALLGSMLAGQSDTLAWLDYFPMHIGDQWQYRAGTDTNWTTTYSISDTASFEGTIYFAYGSDSLYIQYLRPDTLGNIYRYFPEDTMETIWFNFQVAEGDTYHLATDTSVGSWN